ncbi:MAG: type II toxin-antitoxin system prevent-host-death family antitoxin [Candidatus Rokuibacteriota bacterium]|nr:MAG: type II toxin-antitoxin system prevent-host-death family antitoxin [Candidatus Rokubacteria bacterium]
MKVANTVDLKNKTNELLRQVMNGEVLIITYRGKPAASLTALSEDDLEDFVLEHSPKVRKMLAEAEADRKAGRVLPLEAYIAKARSR